MLVGSPEWFHEIAQTQEKVKYRNWTENIRASFLERFSPSKLSEMSGRELLLEVFGEGDSMVRLLMEKGGDLYEFGSTGFLTYLGVVYYYGAESTWKYNDGSGARKVSYSEAEEKAEETRDSLIYCIDTISKATLKSISDYEALENRLGKVFFYDYVWVLKYFQMVFPQYFPGMYGDNTLLRALGILGLPSHGKKKRILNAGEISLFIRRCGISNITFNRIYTEQWGWEKNCPPCEAAKNNLEERTGTLPELDLSYYSLPESFDATKEKDNKLVEAIEEELDSLQLEGADRQALVNVRANQGIFRQKLLNRFRKCCLCGVSEPGILVASHIKPWADCEALEKLDVNNGFLMCPNHDKLFDQGWITFDGNGTIVVSSKLSAVNQLYLNVNSEMKIELTKENKEYLEYHRCHIFQG